MGHEDIKFFNKYNWNYSNWYIIKRDIEEITPVNNIINIISIKNEMTEMIVSAIIMLEAETILKECAND
jgi:hypothetical protein